MRSVNSQRLFRNQELVSNVDIKASGKQMYVHKNIYHCNLPSHIISITNSRAINQVVILKNIFT